MFESGSVVQDDARQDVAAQDGAAQDVAGPAGALAPHALLVSFLESGYAPEQVIGLQTALATIGDEGGPIDASIGDDVLVAAALAAQRLSTWAMHAQVRAATEVYRRRAVPANAALTGHDPSQAAVEADLARRSTAAEIAAVCGVTEYQIRRRLQVGWTLATRPDAFGDLAAAFARGEVELPKVETVATLLAPVAHDATVGAVVDALLPSLPTTTMPRLRRALDAALIQINGPQADAQASAARAGRGVDFRALPDAMGQITAVLPIEGMLAVRAALSALSDAAETPGDSRSTPQRDADTLVDILTQAWDDTLTTASAPAGPGAAPAEQVPAEQAQAEQVQAEPTQADAPADARPRPRRRRPRAEIVVTVPLAHLLDRQDAQEAQEAQDAGPDVLSADAPVADAPAADAPAADAPAAGVPVLAGYGPIPVSVARDLATRAAWRCAVVDDRHGTLLGLGSSTFTPEYRPGAALTRFVTTRDATCRFPGCNRRASLCDIDHITPHGPGVSCECNTEALCRPHHRLKHETTWRVRPSTDPDAPPGSLTWTTPTGRQFVVPAHRLNPALDPLEATNRTSTQTLPKAAPAYLAPPPDCDDHLPEHVIPVLHGDGTLDYLDTSTLDANVIGTNVITTNAVDTNAVDTNRDDANGDDPNAIDANEDDPNVIAAHGGDAHGADAHGADPPVPEPAPF